jgi:predicted acylesterase/phospholipase RssA
MATNGEPRNGKPLRAITLGGGGPAAGLHIGVLDALADADITFDVWSLSCIGAWVGIVYNASDKQNDKDKQNGKTRQNEKAKVKATYEFFKNGVFRDDESYKRFPINTVFGPDWRTNIEAFNKFVGDPKNYREFQWQPYRMFDYIQDSLSIVFNQLPQGEKKTYTPLDEGDLNRWILNQVMAPNPFIRYMTSLMYLSKFNGLSRINYPDSDFMKKIDFDRLRRVEPFIFHNAWNLDKHELSFFANRSTKRLDKTDEKLKKRYRGLITPESLCACSALPFIEETVEIDGTTYCEGALVDTVNFEGLTDLDVHGKPIDEIWISRIVDSKQIRKPENLHDALANLCQLFAASVGEDDVKLFKYHVRFDKPRKWTGTIVEIHVPGHINFKWNHSNLDKGRELGRRAAEQAIQEYRGAKKDIEAHYKAKQRKELPEPLVINEAPEKEASWREVRDYYHAVQDETQEAD